MVSMPKKPFGWGDDLNDLQINRDPSMDAPATVTDPEGLAQPAPDLGAGPDPAYYAKLGEMAQRLITNPNDVEGFSAAGGLLYDAANLAQFKRGHALDAQSYGASPAYGNYVFGVYNAARGAGLPDTLDLANTYGKYFSKYKFTDDNPADQIYRSIPATNVQNITRGYNDYKNGTLRRVP
jgi:hypothetical protein